jgi:hypothetical protein
VQCLALSCVRARLFAVSKPRHQDSARWKMVVDGMELARQNWACPVCWLMDARRILG